MSELQKSFKYPMCEEFDKHCTLLKNYLFFHQKIIFKDLFSFFNWDTKTKMVIDSKGNGLSFGKYGF